MGNTRTIAQGQPSLNPVFPQGEAMDYIGSWQLGHFQLAQKMHAASCACQGMGRLSETMDSHLPDLHNQQHTVHFLEWARLPKGGIEV